MSYCVVILRVPPYWSVRVASCHLKLAGNSFHCRSRTASDITRYILSSTSQKICTRKNLAWKAADEKTVLGCEVRRWKRFSLDENSFLWSSLNQYINNQQPIAHGNCLFRRSPRKPAGCDTVVWIQTWTHNVKISSKWVQTWHVSRQTFAFWENAWQMQAHYSL